MLRTANASRGYMALRCGVAVCIWLGLAAANAEVPHDFHSGNPVRAGEMNTNFQSLDGRATNLEVRVSALEEDPGVGGGRSVTMTVDCGSNADALQGAGDVAGHGDTIEFSGTCNPIHIMRDGLTIRGVTDPLITTAVEVDAVLCRSSASGDA